MNDFGILEFDVPQKWQDLVDDGRLVQPIDDLGQAGQHVERQFEIARVALEDELRLGQNHFADHLVVQRRRDVGHGHQRRALPPKISGQVIDLFPKLFAHD